MELFTVRKSILLVSVAALIAGLGLAKDRSSASEPDGYDELTKREGHFKTTLIRSDSDFSKYTKMYPQKVRLQFREQNSVQDQASTGSMIRKRSKAKPIPDGEDLAKLARIIDQALIDELGRIEAFELVQEAGPDTLVLRVSVTEMVCDISSEPARPEKKQGPFSARGVIVFDLIDAETGVIQARIGERRKSRRAEDPTSSTETDLRWANICAWAEHAAADLRRELERVHSEETVDRTSIGA